MTQKQKKADPKPARTVKSTKSATPSSKRKAAPPRARPRISSNAVLETMVSENELRMMAYSFWENRGRPIGSPEVDWYKAKEQLSPDMAR